MTFVGKVLIVVQLVLSFCFMAFAGAVFTVQTSWKEEHKKIDTRLQESESAKKAKIAELDDLKQAVAKQVNDLTDKRDDWKAQATGLKDQVAALNVDLEVAKTERDKQQSLALVAAEEANMRRVEAKIQRGVNQELHENLDKLGDELRAKDDTIFSLELNFDALIAKHDKIVTELASFTEFLAAKDLLEEARKARYAASGKVPPPPIVESRVLNVRKGTGTTRGTEYVEIQIGEDDGLLKGHNLYVYRTSEKNNGRGAKYLGKIEIVLLRPDRAVGTVIEKAKNGVIQVDDHVTTRL